MAQTAVTCPNCETSFKVDVDATRGKCPSCGISLVFEDVSPAQQTSPPREQPIEPRPVEETATPPKMEEQSAEDVVEETVDIRRIEAAVDAIVERTVTGSKTRAADIAAVESVRPERDYSDVEKKVERLVSKE